jgi:hypothetical protein
MRGPLSHSPARGRSEADLLREGWTRRFVAAPPRLGEALALYESLGFDVHVEPVEAGDLADECEECRLAAALFRVVYTRPKRGASP